MTDDDVISEIQRSALVDPALYGDSFADVYDDWYSDLNDSDFVSALVRRLAAEPQRILELGVGTGRLARLLRNSRLPIVDEMAGVDASESMLTIARDSGVSAFVRLEHGDFSTTLPSGEYDMVFVGYNTLFNLPTTDAIARCLLLVSQQLVRGGVFMIDAVIPRGSSTEQHSETRTMANGDVVRSVSLHNPHAQTITGYFSLEADGHNATMRRWSVHYVHPLDLDNLATAVGLSLESRWADGTESEFGDDSSRHVSTYVKR